MKRIVLLTYLIAACGGNAESGGDSARSDPPEHEPPVMTNANSPVEYPLELFERQVEGTVLLRLFVGMDGVVVPESTQVAESSGEAALDSAAVAGVSNMHFSPARRRGSPVAAAFFQPVHFRLPNTQINGGSD